MSLEVHTISVVSFWFLVIFMANSFGSKPFFNQFMVQVLANTMVMRLQREFNGMLAVRRCDIMAQTKGLTV
jgi:hypothetical protein